MYQPDPFRLTEPDLLIQAIDEAPFATLITSTDSLALSADHLPLLFEASAGESDGVLRGHISRANPLVEKSRELVEKCREKSNGIEALAIFHGPQAYITPSWYPAKREHGRVVPTWNYQVVHAHGRLRLIDDAAWLVRHVSDLTERFEQARESPWSIEDAPADYIAKMSRAIVGLEFSIERLEGKCKASQHKPIEEREAIYHGLRGESGRTHCDAQLLSGLDSIVSRE